MQESIDLGAYGVDWKPQGITWVQKLQFLQYTLWDIPLGIFNDAAHKINCQYKGCFRKNHFELVLRGTSMVVFKDAYHKKKKNTF